MLIKNICDSKLGMLVSAYSFVNFIVLYYGSIDIGIGGILIIAFSVLDDPNVA